MLKGYDESEKAIIKMMNEKREEFERKHRLAFAKEESKETLIKNVKTMHKKGMSVEDISNLLDLNINYVNEIITK